MTIGVALAMVVAACSSSGGKKPAKSGSSTGSGTSSASAAGGVPLNINPGSGTPKRGGTLHMLGTGDVDYMDPSVSYYAIGYLGLRMWSRQLLTYPAVPGHTTDAYADMATQVPTKANGGISADGLTYKLTIKTGVKWDTTPPRQVTAADVVRNVKRTCNPAQPFGGMPDFQTLIVGLNAYCTGFAKVNAHSASAIAGYENSHNIAGVTVDPSNPLTVVYKLTHPASYFTSMLTLPALSSGAPKEWDAYIPASSQLAQHTISDGPYKVSSYNPTKSLDFVRNPAWDPSTDTIRKAYVDAIDINETGQQDSIQQQLKANVPSADMEFDSFPPNSAIPGLISSKDPNFNLTPSYSSNPYVIFNTVSPNNGGALGKVAVRQALEMALNRNHLIQDDVGPQVSPPLTHILPAGISGTKSNTSPSYYPYDPTKAKSELAADGIKTLKFLYRPASSVSKSMFTTIQQDLSQVGITVTGVAVPNADFYTKYLEVPSVAKAGTWDISLAGWGPDWYGDAALSFFAPLFAGPSSYPPVGSNFGFYNNPAVTSLISKAASTADPTQASALWAQADAQVMKDAAIFPITANNQPSYHASHVHNTVPMPAFEQIDPTNVWLSS
ncbi:MAG TPA: ABC transporter substrate-binding protein [Jatrophihabitans sp.]|nr:ABC transporter substrate-binding protein [Jatrophihabitans sp.]